MKPILVVQVASIYDPTKHSDNQDSGGGVGGLSYLDKFKLKKQYDVVIAFYYIFQFRHPADNDCLADQWIWRH